MGVFRLDEILRGSGRYTRREALALVLEGRVTVNGAPAEGVSQRCDESWDIRADGERVRMAPTRTVMLFKPAGYECAAAPERYPPVTGLLPPELRCLFPVGRLDADAEGLLLLTNDGALCHRIIMPESGIVKEYYIEVSGRFLPDAAERFRAGIEADNGLRCLPADLVIAEDGTSARVFVREGKRHQVKRMAAAAGARVRYLRRVAIGGLRLDENLAKGAYRILQEEEIRSIFR